jgi:NhaP-type Na+/H+ or K+/H+ antiporter
MDGGTVTLFWAAVVVIVGAAIAGVVVGLLIDAAGRWLRRRRDG